MAMKMNKATYAEIMEDNIVFLNKHAPKCMTTSHIEDILRNSVEHEYPDANQFREEQKWVEISCSERMPIKNIDTFFVIDGSLDVLQYQGEGYPLYDRLLDETVHYMPTDFWLEHKSLPSPPNKEG